MQNNSLSFIAALSLSTAFLTVTVSAQELPPLDASAAASLQVATLPSDGAVQGKTDVVNNAKSNAGASGAQAQPANAQKEAKKKALETELSNTNVNSEEVLDFPARTSLGELEMATLPGIDESLITGPAPMAPSVSTKDLPSEQLLGRITSEVFQEMADLERGNVFLKLQMQKEQLKNDLEKLKATYRQTRLEEIAKREDVVRARINWWQEQENVRLEMEKKKAETEAVEQQIAEAEELRNKLRAEALAEKENAKAEVASSDVADNTEQKPEEEVVTKKLPRAIDTYSLIAVRGIKGNLTARLKKLSDGQMISVKVNENLPEGFLVEEITKDTITMKSGDRKEVLMFNVVASSTDENSAEN